MKTETDSETDKPRFRYHLCHLSVLGPWASFRFDSHLCHVGIRITIANKQPYCLPNTMLSVVYPSCHSVLTRRLCVKQVNYPFFKEGREAQRA